MKYAKAYEIFAFANIKANFISYCDFGAIFHNLQDYFIFFARKIFHYNYIHGYAVILFSAVLSFEKVNRNSFNIKELRLFLYVPKICVPSFRQYFPAKKIIHHLGTFRELVPKLGIFHEILYTLQYVILHYKIPFALWKTEKRKK